MTRPPLAEWESVFGFSQDPTPGDPEILENLAAEYRSISHDAHSAHSVVSRLDSDELGEGESMEKLRTQLGELPKQVGKLHSSYEAAAAAVATYAGQLKETQDQADRALEKGREAKDRLDSATDVASAASAHVKRLDSAEQPPPDDQQARSSARTALADAREAESEAQRSVESAESDLEAARMLAVDAEELRTSDAGVAKRALEDAEGEAVEGKNFWDRIGDLLNSIFSVIGTVLGVIAMFISGPIGIALAIGSVVFGAASLGLTIGKGFDTGKWDIPSLVMGTVGLAAGGFSILKGYVGVGSLGKASVGIGDWVKNFFTWKPTQVFVTAPQLELDVLAGAARVVNTATRPAAPAPALSVMEGILDGLGLATGIGGLIWGLGLSGKVDGGIVQA
ncbi:putative T7SS-secreted protein [Streptomyces sp. NPDC051684]|uniref:putative T7SS-secreted protein n=1 Tax=Streptomyces sp. NPDC051684 TaxID=3365670 RepID=UPI0037A0371E